jgi:hypothetical protein
VLHRSIAEYVGLRTVSVHYPDLARQKSYTQHEVLRADIVSDWHLGWVALFASSLVCCMGRG